MVWGQEWPEFLRPGQQRDEAKVRQGWLAKTSVGTAERPCLMTDPMVGDRDTK